MSGYGGGGGDGKLPSVDHGPLNEGGRDKNQNHKVVSRLKSAITRENPIMLLPPTSLL